MSKRRTTGKHPDECPACCGFGQNEKCATTMAETPSTDLVTGVPKVVLKTVQLGSGCLRCGGTGRIHK